MSSPSFVLNTFRQFGRFGAVCMVAGLLTGGLRPVSAQTALADQPVLGNSVVPGNLVLPLSVEFPTGISVAHSGAYDTTRDRLGYFDPAKCYEYVDNVDETQRYFQPVGNANNRQCQGQWSGNFLNWATMQTIDPFRWALTGGNRSIDTTSMTVLEKAYSSTQNNNLFPNRTITGTTVSQSTPFGWNSLTVRVAGLGVRMRFTGTGNLNANNPTSYGSGGGGGAGTVFEASVRVRVCDSRAASGRLEANCVLYGSNYKPEGLIQQYSNSIRYSVFGYLNDSGNQRDGAVLRARQKYVGPRTPRPGQSSIVNVASEWDPDTGILATNPNPGDAANTDTGYPAVVNSGVINYLNKFGRTGTYKANDPVGELYYAAIRYLKNQGNVSFWSDVNGANAAVAADAFPVITTWDDPIQYSCQANFILGIGDVNTHADRNVPGAGGALETRGVVADTTVNAVTQTNAVFALEGMNYTDNGNNFNGCCGGNSALMAGLAYDAHVRDIRPDLPDRQSVKTFWVDVLENSQYRKNNQYYLATKYGGFIIPDNFDVNNAAATFPGPSGWNSNNQTLSVGSALNTGVTVDNGIWGTGANRRPDTYFTAGSPDTVVSGLTQAFTQIASDLRLATTSFSLPSPQLAATDNASYSATYSSDRWTGTATASALTVPTNGALSRVERWSTDDTLATQFSGAGWSTNRRVVSFNGARGVPFRVSTATANSGITTAQLALLDTPYGVGVDGEQYLNYLRGERCNEIGATSAQFPTANPACSGTPLGYRARTGLLGDVTGSKLTAVGAPNAQYSDASNPGYSAFRTAQTGRPTMLFFGANDGMLHVLNGALTGAGAGQELFAYVPLPLFAGPSNCSSPATCAANALVSRGNPAFEHRALVDATPEVFDIDFARTGGAVTGNPTPDWRSVVIGGLGKGGRRFYAIDVTSPQTATTETAWANRVLWEFPNAAVAAQAAAVGQMGFTYGHPVVTKLARFGWVVLFPSGYTSATGGTTRSYIFIVNPSNGALLDTITLGTSANPSYDVANVQAFRRDFANNTAESLYAGDALGNMWRVDVRGTTTYPSAVLLARLTAPDGARQPITTRPLIEIDPVTGRRYVLVGTGRLLDATDINSTQRQTFYAIVDGTSGAFSTASTLPTGFSFPIGRAALVANSDSSLTGTGVTATTASPLGWYLDLDAAGGWRVVLDPTSSAGIVRFASLLPNTGVCSSSTSSRTYGIDFGTGQSILVNDNNASIAYNSYDDVVTDLTLVCAGANCTNYTGLRSGQVLRSNERAPTLPGFRRLNWRALPNLQ